MFCHVVLKQLSHNNNTIFKAFKMLYLLCAQSLSMLLTAQGIQLSSLESIWQTSAGLFLRSTEAIALTKPL